MPPVQQSVGVYGVGRTLEWLAICVKVVGHAMPDGDGVPVAVLPAGSGCSRTGVGPQEGDRHPARFRFRAGSFIPGLSDADCCHHAIDHGIGNTAVGLLFVCKAPCYCCLAELEYRLNNDAFRLIQQLLASSGERTRLPSGSFRINYRHDVFVLQ